MEAKRGFNNIEKQEEEVRFPSFFPFVFFLKKKRVAVSSKKSNTFNKFSLFLFSKCSPQRQMKRSFFFLSLCILFVFSKISFFKPKKIASQKKKLTNLTGVAKNQSVAKTQTEANIWEKTKEWVHQKKLPFSTQALKGVAFFYSTRFFKKKKKEGKKKEKGYFFFLLHVHGKTCLKCLLLFFLSWKDLSLLPNSFLRMLHLEQLCSFVDCFWTHHRICTSTIRTKNTRWKKMTKWQQKN